jgi:hypothetical protein
MVDARRELHLLVRDSSGRRVLVVPGEPASLPVLRTEVAKGRSTVETAADAIRRELGLDVPLLEIHFAYEMPLDAGPVPVLVVTEPMPSAAEAPPGLGWHQLDAGDPAVSDWLAPRLVEWLEEWRSGAEPPPLRPRWARDGWYRRAAGWMGDRLAGLGRPPTAPVAQVRHWGISALLRTATDGGAVWLKAVFPPFHHEPGVTALLAASFPADVPAVLATEPEEGWLLLDDLGARTVERDGGEADWRAAPPQLVAIQRAMEDRIGELEALACPRRPLADLPGEIQRIVTEEPRLPGVSLDVAGSAAAVERTRSAVATVGRLGLPDTLVHGDFHAGNVALSDGRTVIFDWSDAAIGNPLVDAVTWLDRIDDPAVRDRTWEAFAAAWSLPEDPDRSLHDAALTAGAAYQVVSYAGILRHLEPNRRLENADGLEDYLGRLVTPVEA